MRKKILTITDTFCVTSKDLVIVEMSRLKTSDGVKIGIPIVIVHPDETEIDGIENILTVSGNRGIAFLIENISKEDVPIGSEVFIEINGNYILYTPTLF